MSDTDTLEDFPLVRGWTPALQTQFLDHLALKGNVAASCKRVGLSREAAAQAMAGAQIACDAAPSAGSAAMG